MKEVKTVEKEVICPVCPVCGQIVVCVLPKVDHVNFCDSVKAKYDVEEKRIRERGLDGC